MPPRLGLWILLAGLALGCSNLTAAADLHVAANGDDASGDGTPGSPWATITHALDNASDGDSVVVGPGTYTGRVRLRGRFAQGVTVRSQVPYQARLRHDATVVTCFTGQGITLEGFDIAHSGPGAGGLVVQIQDLLGVPGPSDDQVERIVLRNNVLHDSYNNDILKINNGARRITVEGNLFYNQQGSDEHIDINSVEEVVVQDNVFFNDFEGSGRTNANDTSSYIVVKDSNGDTDGYLGSRYITIHRNVFLHWQGSTGANFVLMGEDGMPYWEALDVNVFNNLLLGDSPEVMRAPFGAKGARFLFFFHNTVRGDLPSLAYGMRINREGDNQVNSSIYFEANVWSDPTGTMEDFSDTPPSDITPGWTLSANAYWNGGAPFPEDPAEEINISDDVPRIEGDPRFGPLSPVVLPRWQPGTGTFADGSTTIREVFERLVRLYGVPDPASPVVDTARRELLTEDILGNPRPSGPLSDRGAVEVQQASLPEPPLLRVRRTGTAARLTWTALPEAVTYDSYRGTIPATGLAGRGPGPAAYDHACLEAGDADGDGLLESTDRSPGPPEGLAYYLAASLGTGGSSVLGPAGTDLDPTAPGTQTLRPFPQPCR